MHIREKPNKSSQWNFSNSQTGNLMRHIKSHRSKKTNFTSSDNQITADGINLPALTFCFRPLIKPSIKKSYSISSQFCGSPPSQMINLENDQVTWNEFCKNISYQLNRDFTITIGKGKRFINRMNMDLGINDFNGNMVEVKYVLTKSSGLCYTILSNLSFNQSSNYIIQILAKVLLKRL